MSHGSGAEELKLSMTSPLSGALRRESLAADVDYSQIELRLLAEIADIAQLKEALTDIHAMTGQKETCGPYRGTCRRPTLSELGAP
jgi:hypothetical protein